MHSNAARRVSLRTTLTRHLEPRRRHTSTALHPSEVGPLEFAELLVRLGRARALRCSGCARDDAATHEGSRAPHAEDCPWREEQDVSALSRREATTGVRTYVLR